MSTDKDTITVEKGATLTITDSSSSQNGWIVANQEKEKNAIKNCGTLIVEAGKMGYCPTAGGRFSLGYIENCDATGSDTSVTIKGGKFSQIKDTSSAEVTFVNPPIAISGGNFETAPALISVNHQNKAFRVTGGNFWATKTFAYTWTLTSFLADGYSFAQNESGYAEVKKITRGTDQLYNAVTGAAEDKTSFDVQIGDWGYQVTSTTLSKMAKAARDDAAHGHKMTLLKDISDEEHTTNDCYLEYDVRYPGEKLVVDLGTHTWTHVANDTQWTAIPLFVEAASAGTGSCNVTVQNGTLKVKESSAGASKGTIGISNNGIKGRTGQNLTLKNLTIEVDGNTGLGVYLPSRGSNCTIEDCKITAAAAAVETRGTTLAIQESSSGKTVLTSTGTVSDEVNAGSVANNNGSTTTGAALAIAPYDHAGAASVTISGGTFKGVAALLETNPSNAATENLISVNVQGGTYDGAVFAQNQVLTITGGTFTGQTFKSEQNTQYKDIVKDKAPGTIGTIDTDNYATVKSISGNNVSYTVVKKSNSDLTLSDGVARDSDGKLTGYLLNVDGSYENASDFAFKVGNYGFTVADWSGAVAKASELDSEQPTVTLINDILDNASITVDNATIVTLDLNGHTLANTTADTHLITVGTTPVDMSSSAELTITDSSEDQSGAIINKNGSKVAVYLQAGTLNVKGGTIKSSNSTTMCVSVDAASLCVSGGTIQSEKTSAIEVSGGTVSVEGGTISGGTYAIKMNKIEVSTDQYSDPQITSITGGFIEGDISVLEGNEGFIKNANATFTKYFADNYAAQGEDGKKFGCVVKEDGRYFGRGELEVVSAKSEVKQADGAASANVDAITDKKEEVKVAAEKTTINGLTNAAQANDNAKEIENFKTSAAAELKPTDEQTVTVVEVVYPEITAKELNVSETGTKSLKVDIEAMVQLYATTKTGDDLTAETLQQAVKNEESSSTTAKTTIASEPTKLDTTGRAVEVTVPISENLGLISEATQDNVWIKHEVGGNQNDVRYYKASVTKDNAVYNVTFSNPDGFSPFTILVTALGDVEINGVSYGASDVGYVSLPDVGTNNIEGYYVYIAGNNEGFFSTFTNALYQKLLAADTTTSTVEFVAKTKSTAVPNSGSNTGNKSSGTSEAAVDANAAQNVDSTGIASDSSAAAGIGNAAGAGTGSAAQNGARKSSGSTGKSTQNQTVTDTDVEEVVEEEQVAQIEESVVTEEVAEVEGSDLNADEADGGVIVETVGNSYPAWIWLLVVLACAAAGILLFIVFKRRKDENA
jgi:hypothetical protein